jgi:hypothetical protein
VIISNDDIPHVSKWKADPNLHGILSPFFLPKLPLFLLVHNITSILIHFKNTMDIGSSKAYPDDKKSPLAHNETNIESSSDSKNLPMATIEDDDERLLARIGYRQVSSN